MLTEHLLSRGLDSTKYRVFLNEEEGVATLLLWNLSGQLVGYQVYRPSADKTKKNNPHDGRYFTYVSSGQDAIFGLEYLTEEGPIFVVEGTFKAIKLLNLGFNAIAILGSTPKRMKPFFSILSETRKLVAIGDNDKAGYSLVVTVGQGTQSTRDLDEMSDQEVLDLVKSFC